MMLRPATLADHPAIAAFLRLHEASSLFPLANLLDEAAQTLWCAREGAELAGVLALNAGGFLMPQWPGLDPGAARRALAGRSVSAIVGPWDQVTALREAMDIRLEHLRHNGREPLCRLSLPDLIRPEADGTVLRPLREADRETVTGWRMAYNAEAWGRTDTGAREQAGRDVSRWLVAGSHRLLWQGDRPVALTGLNARLPDVVQVGGVYVPPELRNRGHARRAVAFHLAEARDDGAERAVLFAASTAALRAYQAIGFVQTGWMGLALLHKSLVPA